MGAPTRFSRHRFSLAFQDDEGRLFMSEAVPFLYVNLPDNIQHAVCEGDTLFNIAGRYYADLPRGAGLWWAIAQFQPSPIIDPTIKLTPGTVIVVPSVQTIQQRILNEARRRVDTTLG